MFPFMMPADAMMLSIRMTLAGVEASRTLWCAMVQAGTWWMPQDMRPTLTPAPSVCAPQQPPRKRQARR